MKSIDEKKRVIVEKVMGFTVVSIPETLLPEKIYTEWYAYPGFPKKAGLYCRVSEYEPWKKITDFIEVVRKLDKPTAETLDIYLQDNTAYGDIHIADFNSRGLILWYIDNRAIVMDAVVDLVEGEK